MANKSDYLKKFRRCILEYTNAAGSFDLSEEGEDDMMDGGAPNAMDGDPNATGEGQSPEGFSPQGVDPNAGMDGMGGQPQTPNANDPNAGMDPSASGDAPMADPNAMQDDDEVVDVDELIKSQEDAEKKLDKMESKLDKLIGAIEFIVKQDQERERKEEERAIRFKDEMEKRNPTPIQRMNMRSTKSAPYSMTPNEYVNNYMPDNYSADDDNNGDDDPQYKITKSDIDNFTDYSSIAKELDVDHQGLHDILGY